MNESLVNEHSSMVNAYIYYLLYILYIIYMYLYIYITYAYILLHYIVHIYIYIHIYNRDQIWWCMACWTPSSRRILHIYQVYRSVRAPAHPRQMVARKVGKLVSFTSKICLFCIWSNPDWPWESPFFDWKDGSCPMSKSMSWVVMVVDGGVSHL